MSFFRNLFLDDPKFAIYVDLSTKGNYSARLVSAFDDRIMDAKPKGVFLLPVQPRHDTPEDAVKAMRDRLHEVGLHHQAHLADCWVEYKGYGGVSVKKLKNPLR